ncbi:MAG: anti-sigma factor family protein [Trebonia sp.]
MSQGHLGELLSALVDGELSGAELDRANAHVASCGACRVEAHALRRLKHQLRALAEVSDSADITMRLLAMSGTNSQPDGQPGGEGHAAQVPARQLGRERARRGRVAAGRRAMADPYSAQPSRRLVRRRRGRYVLWSTVSLVVVGVGTAFGLGGSAASTGPQITPQLEVFDLQHAVTSGDVPFDDPADVSARVPVVAATP